MWIYGIRLFLTDSANEPTGRDVNYDIIYPPFNKGSKGGKEDEVAMRLLEEYCSKQEIMNKNKRSSGIYQKCLETLALDSNHLERKDKIGKRDHEKECQNCADNHERTECKNNGKRSEGREMKKRALGESFYNQQKDMNNEELSTVFHKYLRILASDSNHFQCKGKIERRDDEEEYPSCKDGCEKMHSFECRNGNVRKNSKRDCPNHREGKNEVGQRDDKECVSKDGHEKTNSFECRNGNVRRDSRGEDYGKFDMDIRTYIDNKFHDMEERLMKRIDEAEASTDRKLDAILGRLEALLNLK